MLKNYIETHFEEISVVNYPLAVTLRKKSETILKMVEDADAGNISIEELNITAQNKLMDKEATYEETYVALVIHSYCVYIMRNRRLEVLNIPIPNSRKELMYFCNEYKMSKKGGMTFTKLLDLIRSGH